MQDREQITKQILEATKRFERRDRSDRVDKMVAALVSGMDYEPSRVLDGDALLSDALYLLACIDIAMEKERK